MSRTPVRVPGVALSNAPGQECGMEQWQLARLMP